MVEMSAEKFSAQMMTQHVLKTKRNVWLAKRVVAGWVVRLDDEDWSLCKFADVEIIAFDFATRNLFKIDWEMHVSASDYRTVKYSICF